MINSPTPILTILLDPIFNIQSHTWIHPKFLYVSAHICKRLSIHNFNLYLSTQLLFIPMDPSSSLPLEFPSVLIPLHCKETPIYVFLFWE